MRYTNAKSDYLLGKYLENTHEVELKEKDDKVYIGSAEWGNDYYYLTKGQLSNREILMDIVCKGAPDVLKYASHGILSDYFTMEEFTDQNIRTFAYFDYNEIANKSYVPLEKHIISLVFTDPTIVLERMSYLKEREADRYCDFVLTNDNILNVAMRRMCQKSFMLDVVNNKTAKQNYKDVFSTFALDNPISVAHAMNNLNTNDDKNVTKNDKYQMYKLISQTAYLVPSKN